MDEEKKNVEDEALKDVAAIPYVAYEMAERRHERREKRHWIAHSFEMGIVLAIVIAFVWLWNQYDTVSTTEATGVYAQILDGSQGIISSDIPPEQIPEIIKALEELYGKSADNQPAG